MKTIIILLVTIQALHAQVFRAAVVKADITPDTPQQLRGYEARKSTGVHDRIHHRVAVLDDGKTRFVLVSSDICSISPSEYEKVAGMLQKEQGIPTENFWWSMTHTHSAPELGPPGFGQVYLPERSTHQYNKAYADDTERKLLDAVAEAIKKLEPARLSAGWGHSNANINRRARNVDGKTNLGYNPDLPVDRKIGMLRIDKADGSPLAIIANYAMHGTVMGKLCTLITGDAPGAVAEYVEKQTGATMLFINGAAGNIAPIYTVQTNLDRLKEFEVLLGNRILDANSKMSKSSPEVKLRAGSTIVETPKRAGLGKFPEYLSNYERIPASGPGLIRIPIRFLKINTDVAIWAAPLEIFCEISNEIRDRSPFPYTFYYGYTNGWLGYLMTDAEIPHGGYEVTVTPCAPGAERTLIDNVMNYLEGPMRNP